MKLEKTNKPQGKKLGKDVIKNLNALWKSAGKEDKLWKATTDIELADELRGYLNVV